MIHLFKHRNEQTDCFQCFDNIRNQQNPYLEWQANEGSAELLMPYKIFIPMLADLISSKISYQKIKQIMVQEFNVTESMIWYRIENLKYEFHQFYKQNKSIDELVVLSNTELLKKGIKIKSINEIFNSK